MGRIAPGLSGVRARAAGQPGAEDSGATRSGATGTRQRLLVTLGDALRHLLELPRQAGATRRAARGATAFALLAHEIPEVFVQGLQGTGPQRHGTQGGCHGRSFSNPKAIAQQPAYTVMQRDASATCARFAGFRGRRPRLRTPRPAWPTP
ncbi:hypothetical protein AY600_20050 [Phormidium willei BDU 130791]|nr:hypothetical protein AY600_20050 [Phormidium willei BDU 130791]